MHYRPRLAHPRKKWATFVRDVAIVIIMLMASPSIKKAYLRWIESANPFEMTQWTHIALIAATFGLLLLWRLATGKELGLLFEWLSPELKLFADSALYNMFREIFAIVVYGIALYFLFYTAKDPLWYGMAFTFYSFILIPGTRYLNQKIDAHVIYHKNLLYPELSDSRNAERYKLYLEAIKTLEAYFLNRQMFTRLWLILFASILAFFVALLGRGVPYWESIASIMFILIIIISEVIVWRWRYVRDNKIKAIRSKLIELDGYI
jgi:hypothetical protein